MLKTHVNEECSSLNHQMDSSSRKKTSSHSEKNVDDESEQQKPLLVSDPRVDDMLQQMNEMKRIFEGREQKKSSEIKNIIHINQKQQKIIDYLKEEISDFEDLKEQVKKFEEHALQLKNIHSQQNPLRINKLVSFIEENEKSITNRLNTNPNNIYQNEINEENPIHFTSESPTNNEDTSNQTPTKFLAYDVASLSCCFFRVVFFICFYTAIIYLWNGQNYTFIAICALASYLLSSFAEILMFTCEGYLKKTLYSLYVLGFIPFWIGFFQPLTDFTFETRMLIVWTMGVGIMILVQSNLLIQMNRQRKSRLLIGSYSFGIIEKIVLLWPALGGYIENEDSFFARVELFVHVFRNPLFIVWPIIFLIHLILLIVGLPVLKDHVDTREETAESKNETENSQNPILEEVEFNDESIQSGNPNRLPSFLGKRRSILSTQQGELNQQTSFVERSQSNLVSEKSFSIYRNGSALSILYGVDNSNGVKGELDKDSYTMMMLSHWKFKAFTLPKQLTSRDEAVKVLVPYPTKPWIIGLSVFLIQASLGSLIILDQLNTSFDTDMSIPIRISTVVQVGQFMTLILALFTQTDILIPFRTILLLWYREGNKWNNIIGEEDDSSFLLWFGRVLIPNVLKIIQGTLILITTFIIIVQSDHIVGLLKDFTALFVISSVDDLFFIMADYGYLGDTLSKRADDAKSVEIIENDTHIKLYLQIAMTAMIGGMLGGWAYVRVGQTNGRYIRNEFPRCPVNHFILNHRGAEQRPLRYFIGDQICDFGVGVGSNIEECGWEGGDCIDFNEEYPECSVLDVSFIGDGWCFGGDYNVKECGFEGGDCVN